MKKFKEFVQDKSTVIHVLKAHNTIDGIELTVIKATPSVHGEEYSAYNQVKNTFKTLGRFTATGAQSKILVEHSDSLAFGWLNLANGQHIFPAFCYAGYNNEDIPFVELAFNENERQQIQNGDF